MLSAQKRRSFCPLSKETWKTISIVFLVVISVVFAILFGLAFEYKLNRHNSPRPVSHAVSPRPPAKIPFPSNPHNITSQKNIFLYWNEESLNEALMLSLGTIWRATKFDVFVITPQNMRQYLSEEEMPQSLWERAGKFGHAPQKDLVLSLLLYKYGGIMMDITSFVWPDRLNALWDKFEKSEHNFMSYMYEPGEEWYNTIHEFTALWFMMSKQNSDVLTEYKQRISTVPIDDRYAFGKRIYDPILEPRYKRNDPSVMFKAALEGPQINEFCWMNGNDPLVKDVKDEKKAWEKVKERMNSEEVPFVKAFSSGGRTGGKKTRNWVLENPDSFFHQMLILCGYWKEMKEN